MPVNWNPQIMKTGFDKIDAQHQGLFDALNSLYDAFNRGEVIEEIDRMLVFLGKYVIEHFDYEKSLMLESAYPDLEKHVYQHDKFVENYLKLKQVFDKEGPTKKLMLHIYNDTYKWLVEHISASDKELGRYLENNH